MNEAHLHLIVNHVSIFAIIIGVIALIVSMRRKSADLRSFATSLFMLGGVFAVVAFRTGEGAEDVIKALNDGSGPLMHEHEEAAEWAQRSGILVALLATALEWAVRKKQNWVRALHWVLLLFAIHGSSVFAATALLGGRIRHTEVRDPQAAQLADPSQATPPVDGDPAAKDQ